MPRFTLVVNADDLATIDRAAGPYRRREFMIRASLDAAARVFAERGEGADPKA